MAYKIEQPKVQAIRIRGEGLVDPVTCYLEDPQPGHGSLALVTFDGAWHAYWPAMGDRTVQQFLMDAGVEYISRKLWPSERTDIDFDAMYNAAVKWIKKNAKPEHAEELLEAAVDIQTWSTEAEMENQLLNRVLGPDWYMDIPVRLKWSVRHMNEAIQAMKDAFKEMADG